MAFVQPVSRIMLLSPPMSPIISKSQNQASWAPNHPKILTIGSLPQAPKKTSLLSSFYRDSLSLYLFLSLFFISYLSSHLISHLISSHPIPSHLISISCHLSLHLSPSLPLSLYISISFSSLCFLSLSYFQPREWSEGTGEREVQDMVLI